MALSLVLSVGEETDIEGSNFLHFFQAAGTFDPASLLFSVRDVEGMAIRFPLLSSSGSEKVTGASPVLSIGDVECGAGRLSPPLPRFGVARGLDYLSVVYRRITVIVGSLGGCSAWYDSAASQIPF